MLLSYCRKARKRKLKSESKIKIKMEWRYLDNHPFKKKKLKSILESKNENRNQ